MPIKIFSFSNPIETTTSTPVPLAPPPSPPPDALFWFCFCVFCDSVTLCPLGPRFFGCSLATPLQHRSQRRLAPPPPTHTHTHTRWDCLSVTEKRTLFYFFLSFPFSIRVFRRYCNLLYLHILAFAFCLSVFLPPQLLLLVIVIIIIIIVVVVVAVSELQAALSTSSSFLMFPCVRVYVCVCACCLLL